MATVTIDAELVRLKVDYKFGDETAFDVDEIISECVVAPVAPDPDLREAIAKAIEGSTQVIDFGDYTVSETDFDEAADAVLSVLAERGVR